MSGIDLFKEYILIQNGQYLHEDEYGRGFIIYSFPPLKPDECFIDEMFVRDGDRKLKVVMDMVRFVESDARRRGKRFLVGAVNFKKNPDHERILMAHFWHKMKIVSTVGDFIYTRKEI